MLNKPPSPRPRKNYPPRICRRKSASSVDSRPLNTACVSAIARKARAKPLSGMENKIQRSIKRHRECAQTPKKWVKTQCTYTVVVGARTRHGDGYPLTFPPTRPWEKEGPFSTVFCRRAEGGRWMHRWLCTWRCGRKCSPVRKGFI